jgi:3-hydroxyisobutyrate dehydrogenase-like beta-hydroxyacid dehydrogenase
MACRRPVARFRGDGVIASAGPIEGGDRVPDEQSSGEPGPKPTVGVVGLGDIGTGVASSLQREGFPLVVCDVRAQATERYADTATVAGAPADLVRQCDVVVVAVVNDEQVRAVLSGPDGGLAAAGPGTSFVVVSTISGPCVQAIGSEAAGLGVPLLDCGVSGGPTAAATGDLVCMVGGDPEVIERVRPVFDAIGSLTVTMGPFGAGLAAKLARNLVQYGSWLAAYEAQRLAEAAGIVLTDLATVIRVSDARIGGASRLMFRSTAAPFTEQDDQGLVDAMRAGASLAHKDLAAALELASSLGVELPLAAMTEDRCDEMFGLGPATP